MCFFPPSPFPSGPVRDLWRDVWLLRSRSPIIFLPPVSSWMVRKCFAALCSSSTLFEACSCLLHPGENRLDRNKMKSPRMTLCQPLGRTLIYSSSSYFHVLFTSFQTLQTMPSANILLWTAKLFTHFFPPIFWILRSSSTNKNSGDITAFNKAFFFNIENFTPSEHLQQFIHCCVHSFDDFPSCLLKSSENLTEWPMNPSGSFCSLSDHGNLARQVDRWDFKAEISRFHLALR